MLAAAPAHSGQPLDLFMFALALASTQTTPTAALVEHFNETLLQARTVLENPAAVGPDISTEAIHLALEIRSAPLVREKLDTVSSYEEVSIALASQLLKEMSPPLEA